MTRITGKTVVAFELAFIQALHLGTGRISSWPAAVGAKNLSSLRPIDCQKMFASLKKVIKRIWAGSSYANDDCSPGFGVEEVWLCVKRKSTVISVLSVLYGFSKANRSFRGGNYN